MKYIFKNFINLLLTFFKVIDENKKLTIIQSIQKNAGGLMKITISPINSTGDYDIYPHEILQNNLMKKQFRTADLKVLEVILITEGDIFIEAKEYSSNEEIYYLKSKVDHNQWKLTKKQFLENKNICNRLNKRYCNEF